MGIEAVSLKSSPGEVALQWGESEVSIGISLQDELHQAVAKAADAVV